ncbi:hypothetical protein FHG87_007458 [Trinorchestia longiramus]|nr:hypothetical protein FHG87_007458 [Trinorchestia longiramus]
MSKSSILLLRGHEILKPILRPSSNFQHQFIMRLIRQVGEYTIVSPSLSVKLLHCTTPALPNSCTVQLLYCPTPALTNSCTDQLLHCPTPALPNSCTAQLLH